MLPKLILRSVEFYWYWHQLLTTVDIVTKLVHSIWNSFIQKIRGEKRLPMLKLILHISVCSFTNFDHIWLFLQNPHSLKNTQKNWKPRASERKRAPGPLMSWKPATETVCFHICDISGTIFDEKQLTGSFKCHADIQALPLFSDSQGCWGNSTQVRTFSPDSGSTSVWKVSRGWDWFSDSQSALSRREVRVKGRYSSLHRDTDRISFTRHASASL